MLRVIQSRSAVAAKSYYSRSDYLSEGQELTGRWGGKAAAMLGLSGDVQKEHFDRLCDNLHPYSGERLTLRQKSDRTTGFDFNLHLPKGVSLAYTLGQDERILDAFRTSVEETMQEIEQEAKTRVRKHGQDTDRVTGNLVWSTFIHKTARPVNGEPDPHVHAHAFLQNVTWDAKEQSWKAVNFRDLKRDAPYFEAVFHSHMAFRMRELGYEIRREGKSWDIAEIPREMRSKFQRRTDQIEELAREAGIVDPVEKSNLGAKTRELKAKELSMPELRELWFRRLDDAERDATTGLAIVPERAATLTADVRRESASMEYATSHCFENHSVVPLKSVLNESLRHGVGFVTVEGMKRQLDQHHVIRRDVEGRTLATTPLVLGEEKQLLDFARNGVGQFEPLNPSWQIQRSWLNSDQRAAVQHVLNSSDRLMMIRGGAGVGKTSLMTEAVEGIEAGGRKVFTFAPSSRASRGVLKAEGFDATTVAELLTSRELQQKIENNVVWIDESGLLGTMTLKRVTDLAEAKNARVILSGDWRQHGSVERGAAMRLLEQHGRVVPAEVRSIQRQTGAYREAVALLAEGKTTEGMQAIDKLGWIRQIEDDSTRYQTMAEEFAKSIHAGETVLATAPTHAEADLLSATIRGELMRRGIVDTRDRTFEQLKRVQLTEAEKFDGERLSEGHVIVFHQNAKNGIRKGQRFEIAAGVHKDVRRQAKRYDLYRRSEIKLAAGDLVRITQNSKTKDGKHRLNNGSVYRVNGFTQSGDMRLDNGWIVDRNFGFIAPGYVLTSHSAQGTTVDRVLVAEATMSLRAASQEQVYVSLSRARKSAMIFTDSRSALMDAVTRSDPRMTATELIGGDRRPLVLRARQIEQKQRELSRQAAVRDQEREYGRG